MMTRTSPRLAVNLVGPSPSMALGRSTPTTQLRAPQAANQMSIGPGMRVIAASDCEGPGHIFSVSVFDIACSVVGANIES